MSISFNDIIGIIDNSYNYEGDSFEFEYINYNSNNLFNTCYEMDLVNSNNLRDYTSNSYNIINNKLNSINTDTLIQGSSNRFIVNDTYNRNITFTNSLYSSNIITSNLSVIGDTTTLNTTLYQTEQLQIINDTTATSMIVKQMSSLQNVAEFYNNTNASLVISSNGFIGINKNSGIQERLDIDGNIKIKGNIYPETDIIYDLGTSNKRFKDLYLSGNSINLDNLLISKNSNNNLEIKDNQGNYKNINLNEIELNNGNTKLTFQLDNDGNLIYKKNNINSGTTLLFPSVYTNITDTSNSVSSNVMINYVGNTSNNLFNYSSNLSLINSNYTSNSSNIVFFNSSNLTYITAISNIDYNNLLNEPWINSGINIYNFNSGNIGIGSTNPEFKLDVNGEIKGTFLRGIGSNIIQINANNISSGTLSSLYGGSKWGLYKGSNLTYNTNNGSILTSSHLCGYGIISNVIPNLSQRKGFLMLHHNTYNGSLGFNYPFPECGTLYTNMGIGDCPWGFYTGVVKHTASTSPNNSLRFDIGQCAILNTLETLTGTNTFNPYLSMTYNGFVGIGSSFPTQRLDVNGNTNSIEYLINNKNISNIFTSSNVLLSTSNFLSNLTSYSSNSNFIYTSNTSNTFNNRLATLNINTDTITQGSSNRFIVNDIYNRNITFTGSLISSNITTSNLNVIGDTTTFNTTIYQTEQLQVVNDTTATSMIIKQVNSNNNVAELYYQNNQLSLIINSNGNIGIGTSNPLNKLDVNGNINTSGLLINGTNIQTTITNSSNNLANYTSNINNNLSTTILNNSNYFSNLSLTNSNNLANYTSNINNNLSTTILNNSNYFSNLSLTNSNNLANYTSNINNNLSTTILNNSNYFSNLSLTNSNNLANYTSNINNNLSTTILNNSNYFSNLSLTNSNNLANYTSNNSNIFNNRLATLNINTDTITQGSSNRFIVNDIYNRSVNFTGNFLTSSGTINSFDTINFYSSNTPASITWSTKGVSALGVAHTSNQLSSNASAGDMILRSDINKKLIIQNGSNNASIIISNNFVGIGITNPLYNLDVNSNINSFEYFIKNQNISNIFVSSNVFDNRSNNLFSYTSNTSNTFNNRLATLNINTDTITQGSSNRFIVNDIYNRNITFTGSLISSNITTSNLNVIGDTTTFNTTIYQTEQLQVVNDTTATAMIIKQVNSNNNVAELYYQNNQLSLIINSNGNIGIGTTNPLNKLDVNGNINTSGLLINGTDIQTTITNSSNNLFTIINNSYCKKTTFYFTPYISYLYNSTTYYTYNIEISKFVRFIQISPTIKLSKFRIHIAPMDCNFNGSEIRECEYLIMISDLNGLLSVRAIGTPQDTYLQKIQSWKIVKSASFAYLTYISPIQNINILCSIIDEA